VTASSPGLESPVDPRFGRCAYYLIVDPETMGFEALENPHVAASAGAGIQAAQLIAHKNVEAVLTGSCGPNAFLTLKAAGVKVVVGVTGTASEAVRKYAAGEYREASGPDVPTHHGTASAGGMGRGRGRGVGGAQGSGRPGPAAPPVRPAQVPETGPTTPDEDLEGLKEQAAELRRQMERVFERIAALEQKKK